MKTTKKSLQQSLKFLPIQMQKSEQIFNLKTCCLFNNNFKKTTDMEQLHI